MKIFNNMGNAWVVLLKVHQHAKSCVWHFSQLHKLSLKITTKLLITKKIGSRHKYLFFFESTIP